MLIKNKIKSKRLTELVLNQRVTCAKIQYKLYNVRFLPNTLLKINIIKAKYDFLAYIFPGKELHNHATGL